MKPPPRTWSIAVHFAVLPASFSIIYSPSCMLSPSLRVATVELDEKQLGSDLVPLFTFPTPTQKKLVKMILIMIKIQGLQYIYKICPGFYPLKMNNGCSFFLGLCYVYHVFSIHNGCSFFLGLCSVCYIFATKLILKLHRQPL